MFAGITVEELARLQGISARTVKWSWAYTRAWLRPELAADRNR